MKKFKVKQNSYLDRDVIGYYNCEYLGYQQKGNPDFINRLKNMTKTHGEMDLVQDFIEVAERAEKDLKDIIDNENLYNPVVCVLHHAQKLKRYIQIVSLCSEKQFLVLLIILAWQMVVSA